MPHPLVHPDASEDEDAQQPYLLERYAWLVRVRWVAVSMAALLVALAPIASLARGPLLACVGAQGLANVGWDLRRRRTAWRSARAVQDAVFHQLLVDIVVLAMILHLSGGGENPFAMLYPLPMALGATLLRTRQAIALGVTGTLSHAAVVLGELFGVLTHHSIDAEVEHAAGVVNPLFSTPELVAGYLLAFAAMNLGVVFFARSVTSRYHQAEALRRQHDQVALSRERLVRIGELSAGVAHAVRNPVHGLLNAVSLLESRHGADPASEETLHLMRDVLLRMESVTRRLLALGSDTGLRCAPCDVDTLIADVLRLVTPHARGSAARLDYVRGGAGVAQVDSGQLGEALANVLDNALDACRGGGQVHVTTRGTPEAVEITVADDGPGVTPEVLPALFDPFFTTKPEGEGTGLGLAITRRIIDEHGGRITLDSAPGRGLTVRLWLPREAARNGARA